MNAIIQKLGELNKLDVTLPISKQSIQINKINLELQSKFEDFTRNMKNELTATTQYIQFIANHIKKETSNDLHYLDKLHVLLQWFNDLKKEENIEFRKQYYEGLQLILSPLNQKIQEWIHKELLCS